MRLVAHDVLAGAHIDFEFDVAPTQRWMVSPKVQEQLQRCNQQQVSNRPAARLGMRRPTASCQSQ